MATENLFNSEDNDRDESTYLLNEIYDMALRDLEPETNDPKLYVAVYYYMASLVGFGDVTEYIKQMHKVARPGNPKGMHWYDLIAKYINTAQYRYSADDLFNAIVHAITEYQESEGRAGMDHDAWKLLRRTKDEFYETISFSLIGQPEYSGIALGFYDRNTRANRGVIH